MDELKDAYEFWKQVNGASDDERMAVGTDHWVRLLKAVERVLLDEDANS